VLGVISIYLKVGCPRKEIPILVAVNNDVDVLTCAFACAQACAISGAISAAPASATVTPSQPVGKKKAMTGKSKAKPWMSVTHKMLRDGMAIPVVNGRFVMVGLRDSPL
jgi:hypothetical protein